MAKKEVAKVNLQIKAGKANPAPPVGPALGQHGVNIREFCEAFNNKTKSMDPDLPVPVLITIYSDRSFSFEIKSAPASALLKKIALKGAKGSPKPNTEKVGSVNREQLIEIAQQKDADLSCASLEAAIRTIAGTARSMGIEVEGV